MPLIFLLLVTLVWLEGSQSYVGFPHRIVSSSVRQCGSRRCGSRATTSTMLKASERNYNTFVKVKSNFEAATILEHDENCSLKDYMRLPVDQYVCIKMPLDAKLQRLNSNFFNLTVPPVTFFNLEVSPTVQCTVSQTQDAVVIESESVHLGGSPYVEGLNGCFKIRIQTIFNWIDRDDYKAILSRSAIDVDVDPPPPFKFFGKRVLETTGTLAMSIALRQIENAFVTNLGTDFSRWAVDENYRKARAGGACELEVDEEEEGSSISNSDNTPSRVAHGSIKKESAGAVVAPVESLSVVKAKEEIKGSTSFNSVVTEGGVPPAPPAPATATATATASSVIQPAPGLKSEVPAINVAKKVTFPVVGEEVDSGPIALRDIPLRASPGPGTWEEEEEEERKREKQQQRTLNTGVDSPNPGIPIPFTAVPEDETPASLLDDVCLVPGEPIVRVEEAPDNARRIFTGIDITADVEDVWAVLTDYENLGNVIPSLVKNEVLERSSSGGARLSQVGGAKILPGLTFTAKTVLDVRVYREDNPIPEEMTADHLPDAPGSTAGDKEIRDYDRTLPLQRGVFPRPYAITALKHRDITMQNVEGMGDFDHYQGIWRLQRLPNCAPDGGDAARLTYAVELRPKGFLPVSLIEGRIAGDLKNNLDAIRRYVQARTQIQPQLGGSPGLDSSSGSDGADADAGVDGGGSLSLLEKDVVVAGTEGEGVELLSGATTHSSPSSLAPPPSPAPAAAPAAANLQASPLQGRGVSPASSFNDDNDDDDDDDDDDRVGLDAVIAAIKLAQISEITLGDGGVGMGVLRGAGGGLESQGESITSGSNDSAAGANTNLEEEDTGVVGDDISPKKWSYRRLLVTGSGFTGTKYTNLVRAHTRLTGEVERLRQYLEEISETIDTIDAIVPSEYVPGAILSSTRLADIKRAMREFDSISSSSSEEAVTEDIKEVVDEDGDGDGDVISAKRWSYRRLLVTGSGFVKWDRRNYMKETRQLESERIQLEARLAARKTLLKKIADMSGAAPEDGGID